MGYSHDQLAYALGWKYHYAPGICTSNGALTEWPEALGPKPTEAEQAQCVADYEVYRTSPQRRIDALQKFLGMTNLQACGGRTTQALVGLLIDKGVFTMDELEAKYRSL